MTLETYLRQKYSSTSQIGYLNAIKRYLAFSNQDALNATYQDILDFIAYLRTTNLHPKTLRNYLFSVKVYYQWLLITEQRADHPCKTLYLTDPISKAIPIETLYTDRELLQLLETHRPKKSYIRYRDKLILSLLIFQALTTVELVQIRVQDMDLDAGTLHIPHPHPKRRRTLALQSNQILLIMNYLNIERPILLNRNKQGITYENLLINNEGRPLQPNGISRQINQYRSKDDKITPIKIRQSTLRNLLKKGNDLRIVQVFAGHRRSSSTEAYKQTGLEELKNIIQKHHPLA